jgi:hypothetical protein
MICPPILLAVDAVASEQPLSRKVLIAKVHNLLQPITPLHAPKGEFASQIQLNAIGVGR